MMRFRKIIFNIMLVQILWNEIEPISSSTPFTIIVEEKSQDVSLSIRKTLEENQTAFFNSLQNYKEYTQDPLKDLKQYTSVQLKEFNESLGSDDSLFDIWANFIIKYSHNSIFSEINVSKVFKQVKCKAKGISATPFSQFNLARIYFDSKDEEKRKKTIKWCTLAANQGFVPAQYNLNRFHHLPRLKNGPQYYKTVNYFFLDYSKSIYWLMKAAEKNPSALQKSYLLSQETSKELFTTLFQEAEVLSKNHESEINLALECFTSILQSVLNRHDTVRKINNFDLLFKENADEIPELKALYQEIFNFEQQCLNLLSYLNEPNFMITCIEPNKNIVDDLKAGTLAKVYTYQSHIFLTLGEENIRAADQMMAIIEGNTAGQKAAARLIKLETQALEQCSDQVQSTVKFSTDIPRQILIERIAELNTTKTQDKAKAKAQKIDTLSEIINPTLSQDADHHLKQAIHETRVSQLQKQFGNDGQDEDVEQFFSDMRNTLSHFTNFPDQFAYFLIEGRYVRNKKFIDIHSF